MKGADKYYGKHARGYDAARCRSARWQAEQVAVAAMVSKGPVLDVPVGTGRYLSIYRAKGLDVTGLDISADMLAEARAKDGGIELVEGSVFALPFPDQSFGTVVCTRLLDWLSPPDMERAVAELRRVAYEIVVTVRTGTEGVVTNWTHDLGRFYAAIEGLHVAARATTEQTEKYGHEEAVHLRPPAWADVVGQFPTAGGGPVHHMNRIANVWVGRLLESPVKLTTASAVRAEYWTADRLWTVIEDMAALWDEGQPPKSRYVTDETPRREDLPVTILSAQGSLVVLDGRRRINAWRGRPGRFPVLLIQA